MSAPRPRLVPRPEAVETVLSPRAIVVWIFFVGVGVVDIVLMETSSIGFAAAMRNIALAYVAVIGFSWIGTTSRWRVRDAVSCALRSRSSPTTSDGGCAGS